MPVETADPRRTISPSGGGKVLSPVTVGTRIPRLAGGRHGCVVADPIRLNDAQRGTPIPSRLVAIVTDLVGARIERAIAAAGERTRAGRAGTGPPGLRSTGSSAAVHITRLTMGKCTVDVRVTPAIIRALQTCAATHIRQIPARFTHFAGTGITKDDVVAPFADVTLFAVIDDAIAADLALTERGTSVPIYLIPVVALLPIGRAHLSAGSHGKTPIERGNRPTIREQRALNSISAAPAHPLRLIRSREVGLFEAFTARFDLACVRAAVPIRPVPVVTHLVRRGICVSVTAVYALQGCFDVVGGRCVTEPVIDELKIRSEAAATRSILMMRTWIRRRGFEVDIDQAGPLGRRGIEHVICVPCTAHPVIGSTAKHSWRPAMQPVPDAI